jgi:hypothetical protein
MMHPVADLLLTAALSAVGSGHPEPWHSLPLDTAVAVATSSTLTLDLRTGGRVHITEGVDGIVRIRARAGARQIGDCNTLVTRSDSAIRFITERPALGSTLAQLEIEIEVPRHYNIALNSAGGDVEIEGIDGTVTGVTHFGELRLRRLSGAIALETGRGNVTLRESYLEGSVRTLEGRVLMEDIGGTVDGLSEKGRVVKRRVREPVADGSPQPGSLLGAARTARAAQGTGSAKPN